MLFRSKRRKNIVTIWTDKNGNGEIIILKIGKYGKRQKFDVNDIGTEQFSSDLFTTYKKTQE